MESVSFWFHHKARTIPDQTVISSFLLTMITSVEWILHSMIWKFENKIIYILGVKQSETK